MGYDATLVYQEDWAATLQAELDEPNKFKDICEVEYTNTKVLNNPYLTDATVMSLTRGTAYTMQTITETNESVSIDESWVLAQFIDRADLAQSRYTQQMRLAERQGILLNEKIESRVYGYHASLTDFGTENLAGSAGSSAITVSDTNIDNIITNLKRTIRAAGGESLMARNGVFIVWRPADFEILERYMMANGFATADAALKGGVSALGGIEYMGVTHYSSNLLTASHVIGGVKKVLHLGILRDTYGQIVVNPYDPSLTSGISVTSRVDFKVKAWTKTVGVLFDINVA